MKVEKSKLSKYLPAILLGMLFAYVGFRFIRYRIELSRMDKDGVYVIAYVSDIGNSKNGKKYYFDYAYKGDTIHYMFKDLAGRFRLNELYFFRILKDKPEVNEPLFDMPVPSCITLSSMPFEGWKTIPTCP
jgi:hypothetical protein